MLIREKDRLELLRIFDTAAVPITVWAYGSRVKGSAHKGSDLDLVIRSQNLSPIPTDIFSDLYDKIKDSNIPILVDLKDWALVPENFRKNIREQYEVLYETPNP